jgi:putative transposase
MTVPRRVLPGTTLLITRRCLGRMFLLRPSKQINRLIGYILAVAAARYEIQVHCFCVLSNHFHLVITDTKGTCPAFMRDLCALIARSCNSLLGRWEHFWAPGSYSAVALLTPADTIDKMAYVLANPAAAGLVQHCREWPGLWSSPTAIGGDPLRFDRPTHFFRQSGPLPATAVLQLVCPPGFTSCEDLRTQLLEKVAALELEAALKHERRGHRWLGINSALAQNPLARPESSETRRGLNPRIASRDKWKRIEAIGRLKEFLRQYRQAWKAFAAGIRDTVFPLGTYWMRVAHGVTCAATL